MIQLTDHDQIRQPDSYHYVSDDVPVVKYIPTSSFVASVFYVAAGLTILFTTLILCLLL